MKATKLGNHSPTLKLCDSSSIFPLLVLMPYIQSFGKYKAHLPQALEETSFLGRLLTDG